MSKGLKNFVLAMVLFGALDTLWFSIFMEKFATEKLRPMLQVSGELLVVNFPYAIFVYLVMAFMASVFLVPYLDSCFSILGKAMAGFLFGFGIYSVFDFTNLALFPNYDFTFAIIDCLWGGFIFSVFAVIVALLSNIRFGR